MGVLKSFGFSLALLSLVCISLLYSCNSCVSSTNVKSIRSDSSRITIDSLKSPYALDSFYSYSGVIEGIYHMRLESKKYWVVLKKSPGNVVVFKNSDVDSDFKEHILDHTFSELAVSDSFFYGIDSGYKSIYKYQFLSNKCVPVASIQLPHITIPKFFIAANIHAPIEVIDSSTFLVPYRIKGARTVNMIDTYAYLLFKIDDNGDLQCKKVIPYPPDYLQRYQLLRSPILAVDRNAKQIVYTFEGEPKLYSCNVDCTPIRSINQENFKKYDFDTTKTESLEYMIEYRQKNDQTSKIFCNNGLIYVVRKNKILDEKLPFHNSSVYCYNTKPKLIDKIDFPFELNPEISFIENETTYIYISQSHNYFIGLTRKLSGIKSE